MVASKAKATKPRGMKVTGDTFPQKKVNKSATAGGKSKTPTKGTMAKVTPQPKRGSNIPTL